MGEAGARVEVDRSGVREGRTEACIYFPQTGPKVPHSRPAPKRKYGNFDLGVRKNSICSAGVKLASPQLVFATRALKLFFYSFNFFFKFD